MIGFRGNDGTDYFNLDQAYPISSNGLLFDVGTTTAGRAASPLFAIWSEGTGYAAAFTGNVGGTEYSNLQGSAMASATGAVPEPSTWAMGLLGFGGLGLMGWRKSRAESAGRRRLKTETRPAPAGLRRTVTRSLTRSATDRRHL